MPPSPTLRWSAYEHEHIERSADWFWALGIIAASIALVSILFHNLFFAVIVVIAAAVLGMIANIPPDLTEFELSDKGVRTGDTLHRFEEIISFWVEEDREHPLLLIDTTKIMAPNLIIPIQHIDPRMVRAFLQERATEVRMKEPFSHKVLEFFGL